MRPLAEVLPRFLEATLRQQGRELELPTVTDEELSELERELYLSFPAPYALFLKTSHFPSLSVGGISFCPHPREGWKEQIGLLYSQWRTDLIEGRKFIPFGRETNLDAGPVCFDTVRKSGDDCPVVFCDREWAGTDLEVNLLFSSSEAMFRCLAFCAVQNVDFFHQNEGDTADQFLRKCQLMGKFLELDPRGAGSLALEHWTRWGIVPGSEPPSGADAPEETAPPKSLLRRIGRIFRGC